MPAILRDASARTFRCVTVRGKLARVSTLSRAGSVVILICLVTCTHEARAQQDDTDEVQSILASAISEYDAHRYEEAYALFLRVHEARPSARSARALGNASFELRRYREAIRWYEQSLSEGRNPLTDEMRAEVQDLLVRARAFVGHYTVSANVEDVRVSLDGALVEPGELVLELGEHVVTAEADGFEPATRRLRVRGGERETLTFTLLRSQGPATVSQISERDPGGTVRNLGWASMATGGALVAGGVVATTVWARTVSSLNANVEAGACTIDPETEAVTSMNPTCLNQQSRYRLAGKMAIASYGASVVFLGLGLGLVFGAPSTASESDAVTVVCGPFAGAGLACTGRF